MNSSCFLPWWISKKPCLLRLPEFLRLLSRSKGTHRLLTPRVSSVGYELSNWFLLFLRFFRPFVLIFPSFRLSLESDNQTQALEEFILAAHEGSQGPWIAFAFDPFPLTNL